MEQKALEVKINMANVSLNELVECRDISMEMAKSLIDKKLKPEQEMIVLSSLIESFQKFHKEEDK